MKNNKKKDSTEDIRLKKEISAFFLENPNPNQIDIEKLAKKIGISVDKLEKTIHGLLGAFLGAGRSKGFTGEYDQKELAMGVKVEMEHTTDEYIAKRIAKDHLAEFDGKYYYTALKKMENELESK